MVKRDGSDREPRGSNLFRRKSTSPAIASSPRAPARAPIIPPETGPIPSESIEGLSRDVRKPAIVGLAIVLTFFGVGGVWAAVAPLAGAVIASGVISPEGSRRTVQHLEGGIIRSLLARDGDEVQNGDPLVVLEAVGARAEVGRLEERLRTLAATEARLRAERDEADEIAFEHEVLALKGDPDVRASISAQVQQFETRRSADANRTAILWQKIEQLRRQIAGLGRQLDSNLTQRELINEETVDVQGLYDQGLERKTRLLALQREHADLLGEAGELEAEIARADEQIGEARLQILDLRIQRMEEVDAEFAEIQTQRGEVEEQIEAARDQLRRTEITAPIAGTVVNSQFKTTGGVIRPGEAVLDLVPEEEELIIDARIAPTDIDNVVSGQDAYVMFPALPQRNLLRIDGSVQSVSADALLDEESGTTFYQAKVEVDPDELMRAMPDLTLTPGMPAEVFITTGERTLSDYLFQPFLQSVERTFRES